VNNIFSKYPKKDVPDFQLEIRDVFFGVFGKYIIHRPPLRGKAI